MGFNIQGLHDSAALKNSILIIMRIATTALGFLLLRLLSDRMVKADYDIYIIIKQIIAWFIAIGFLGMATALPRTIIARKDKVDTRIILLSAFILLLPGVVLPMIIISVYSDFFSQIIFKSSEWGYVVGSLWTLVFGLSFLSLLNLYLRGENRFRAAMLVELIGQGVLPLMLVLYFGKVIGVSEYLIYYGCALNVLIFVFMLLGVKKDRWGSKFHIKSIWGTILELLDYGVPKLLSGAYQMCLIGMLPIAMRWTGADLSVTAATTLGMSIGITMSTIAVTPNSLVTFNKIVRAKHHNKKILDKLIKNILKLAIIGGIVACLLGGLGTDLVVHYMIGPVYDEYRIFINAGAIIGFTFFSLRLVEIPLDGMNPPWKKAKVSLAMIVATMAAILVIIGYGKANPMITIAVIYCSLIFYLSILVRLVSHGRDVISSIGDQAWRIIPIIAGLGILYFAGRSMISREWIQGVIYILLIICMIAVCSKCGLMSAVFSSTHVSLEKENV